MYKIILPLCACLFYRQVSSVPVGVLQDFVRTNLVGHPVIHDQQTWIFDPDLALKRRPAFIRRYGDKGEKLIEILGLGIDGGDDERLERQRQRDKGHLGGLNYFLP